MRELLSKQTCISCGEKPKPMVACQKDPDAGSCENLLRHHNEANGGKGRKRIARITQGQFQHDKAPPFATDRFLMWRETEASGSWYRTTPMLNASRDYCASIMKPIVA